MIIGAVLVVLTTALIVLDAKRKAAVFAIIGSGTMVLEVIMLVAGLALLIVLTVNVSKSAIARYKESHAA
ncbi:MAG: hypothetical protein JXR76_08530 [Deltaproteobacteria bacterium]|nr:hypothetical protein [Deltaproteobacteria bacterium]